MMGMGKHGKGFLYLMFVTAGAILLIEPLVEKTFLAISPTYAAKLGITA